MASTRKGGRTAKGAAESSKRAAAAGSATRAGAANASKRSAKKGGSRGNVTHPPVIITDGSAAIGLVPNVFRLQTSGGTTRIGRRLRLLSVEIAAAGGSETCLTLSQNESAVITVSTTIGGASPKSFTVRGINSNDPSSLIVLDFDHGVFQQGPIVAGRRIFRHPNRTIDSLVIVTSTGMTHDCDLVGQPGFVITFRDDHV